MCVSFSAPRFPTCWKRRPGRRRSRSGNRAAYGNLADDIIAEHKAFLHVSSTQVETLKHKILDNWDEIQAIAAQVPPTTTRSPICCEQAWAGRRDHGRISFDEEERDLAIANGHYLATALRCASW